MRELKYKRLLSLILTFALLSMSLFIPPYFKAQALNEADFSDLLEGDRPLIIVRGVDLGAYYTNFGSENQAPALGELSAEKLVPAIIRGVSKSVIFGNFDYFIDETFIVVEDFLGNLAFDKSGAPVYDLGYKTYPLSVNNYYEELVVNGGHGAEEGIVKGAAEHFGAENVYYFTYDWREDPLKISDELALMIDRALADHECEKINLICASMGGLEAVAYFSKYGHEKVDKCIFLSAAFYGLYMVSDLFCGRVEIKAENLYNFLLDKIGENIPLNILIKSLRSLGTFKLLEFVAQKIIERYKLSLFDDLLTDMLATMPVWWALVLPEDFEEAKEFLFAGRENEYAGILEIAESLQAMMKNRDETLKKAEDGGVSFAVISAYNTAAMPIYSRSDSNSDGGLETALMSGGGNLAPFGKSLLGFLQGEYISPDGVVDASACLFPDTTWFIKNGDHVGCSYGSQEAEFLFALIDYKGSPTVYSFEKYPRFLIKDSRANLLPLQ